MVFDYLNRFGYLILSINTKYTIIYVYNAKNADSDEWLEQIFINSFISQAEINTVRNKGYLIQLNYDCYNDKNMSFILFCYKGS